MNFIRPQQRSFSVVQYNQQKEERVKVTKTRLYRIEYPAYADRPANSLLVNGDASRDRHIAQIADKGCTEFKVTELTAVEYRAVALSKLKG